MKTEELKKLSKTKLLSIASDLGMEVESDNLKGEIADKIASNHKWKDHAEYKGSSTVDSVDEFQQEVGGDFDLEKANLIEECVAREVVLNGDESVDQLKSLIAKDDDEKIAEIELQDAKQRAVSAGLKDLPTNLSTEEINIAIVEKKAEEGRMQQVNAEQEKALKDHIAKGVTLDYLQKVNSHLIDATQQMIRQCEREKKSSDRFHATVKKLEVLRREVFIR